MPLILSLGEVTEACECPHGPQGDHAELGRITENRGTLNTNLCAPRACEKILCALALGRRVLGTCSQAKVTLRGFPLNEWGESGTVTLTWYNRELLQMSLSIRIPVQD